MGWSDDAELVATFRAEMDERLASLSSGLLSLESSAARRPLVAQLFRDAHTAKGSARMLGLDDVVALAHRLEDVLGAVRDGRVAVSPSLVDLLLAVVDAIGSAVPDPDAPGVPDAGDGLPRTSAGRAAPDPLEGLRERLSRVLSGGGADGPAREADVPEQVDRRARGPAARPVPAPAAAAVGGGGFGGAPPPTRSAPPAGRPEPAPEPVPLLPRQAVAEPELVPAVPAVAAAPEAPPARRADSVRVASGKVYALLDGVGEAELGARRLEQATTAGVADLADVLRLALAARRELAVAPPTDAATALPGRSSVDGAVLALDRLVARAEEALRAGRGVREVAGSTLAHVAVVRDSAMALAMVPVGRVFHSLPRLARSVAAAKGVEVDLRLLGVDVELDKQVLDGVAESLQHLVTNAVDHGCEPVQTRRAAGKADRPVVEVEARASGGRVTIEVRDNGAGVDTERLRAVAVERGLLPRGSDLAGADLLELLFTPALSTASRVTETSGRGVGLDVVRAAVEDIGGAVTVRSSSGQGTAFTLSLPVTLGVLRCLVVRVGPERYAVPVPAVAESVGLRDADVRSVAGAPVLLRGERALPLLDLRAALGAPASPPVRGGGAPGPTTALVTSLGDRAVAWAVDALEGELEMVVKDLGAFLGRLPLVPGATLDAAGRVVCLLDLRELAEQATTSSLPAAQAPQGAGLTSPPRASRVLVVEDSVGLRELQRVVLSGAGMDVETCVDGAAGVARLEGPAVDLVVTDVEMPGLDGISLTRRLRATPGWEAVPVVIMTSRDEPEFRRAGLDAGADAYLLKQQFDQASLVETVRRLLGEELPEEEQQ